MRSAPARSLILGLALVAACKPSPYRLDAGDEPPADAFVAPWWTPKTGEAKDWDIQLRAPYDLSAARAMYILDLFQVVPAQRTLDYGDGASVTVPAGPQATAIAMLKAMTPPPKVVCRVSTGAIDLDDPDAVKFDGYGQTLPDRPTPPPSTSVIGWTTRDPNNPNERFLDIRAASRGRWAKFIYKRFDLAKDIGCDAIYADHSDVAKEGPGWEIPEADQSSWYIDLANQAHAREMSVGMQSKYAYSAGMMTTMSSRFDWVVQERCAEFDDCERMGAFLGKTKATFALDFRRPDSQGNGIDPSLACTEYARNMANGLVKDETLSSAFRHLCP